MKWFHEIGGEIICRCNKAKKDVLMSALFSLDSTTRSSQ